MIFQLTILKSLQPKTTFLVNSNFLCKIEKPVKILFAKTKKEIKMSQKFIAGNSIWFFLLLGNWDLKWKCRRKVFIFFWRRNFYDGARGWSPIVPNFPFIFIQNFILFVFVFSWKLKEIFYSSLTLNFLQIFLKKGYNYHIISNHKKFSRIKFSTSAASKKSNYR